jgi:hypothetical protein
MDPQASFQNRLALSGVETAPVASAGPKPFLAAGSPIPEAATPLPAAVACPTTPAAVTPGPAPDLTPPEAKPGPAPTGGGSPRRIRPHWRYTWNDRDFLCGPCIWILLYRSFRNASQITLSIASGFVRCARCGRGEA